MMDTTAVLLGVIVGELVLILSILAIIAIVEWKDRRKK